MYFLVGSSNLRNMGRRVVINFHHCKRMAFWSVFFFNFHKFHMHLRWKVILVSCNRLHPNLYSILFLILYLAVLPNLAHNVTWNKGNYWLERIFERISWLEAQNLRNMGRGLVINFYHCKRMTFWSRVFSSILVCLTRRWYDLRPFSLSQKCK